MTIAGLIVLAHALAGIVFVTGIVGRWIALAAASSANDLVSIKAVLAVSARFERMVVVGSFVVLVLGIGAAIAVGRPLLGPLQGGRIDWLFVSVILFVSNLPLVPLVFLPRGRVFGAALAAAERHGDVTAELRAAFHDPVTYAAHVYELATATIVLVLMLTKPF